MYKLKTNLIFAAFAKISFEKEVNIIINTYIAKITFTIF